MIVALITARSKSTRFPDKFKADIHGKPMLVRVVEQVKKSSVDRVVVATVTDDWKIQNLCQEYRIPCYEGSENDILGRLYGAAEYYKANIVVRIWGDSPLIEPVKIDSALDYYRMTTPPYVAYFSVNGVVAVLPMKVLTEAHETVTEPKDREWIHTYLSGQTGALVLSKNKPVNTVDTYEDLERVRELWVKSG